MHVFHRPKRFPTEVKPLQSSLDSVENRLEKHRIQFIFFALECTNTIETIDYPNYLRVEEEEEEGLHILWIVQKEKLVAYVIVFRA